MVFLNENEETIVKFTTSYSVDIHRLLEINDLAPKLIDFKEIKLPLIFTTTQPCILVKMEYLKNYKRLSECKEEIEKMSQTNKTMIAAQIRQSLELIHDSGFVHGDFRHENILLNLETCKIKVIDFELSGKCGNVVYPFDLNFKDIEWHKEVRPLSLIQKEHDI